MSESSLDKLEKAKIAISLVEEADLRKGNYYNVLTDENAEQFGMIRIVDETGEDYLYPVSSFKVRYLWEAIVQDIDL